MVVLLSANSGKMETKHAYAGTGHRYIHIHIQGIQKRKHTKMLQCCLFKCCLHLKWLTKGKMRMGNGRVEGVEGGWGSFGNIKSDYI